MAVIKSYLEVDEEKAVDAMEILDELIESEVGLIVPYVASIVHVCLEVRCGSIPGPTDHIVSRLKNECGLWCQKWVFCAAPTISCTL